MQYPNTFRTKDALKGKPSVSYNANTPEVKEVINEKSVVDEIPDAVLSFTQDELVEKYNAFVESLQPDRPRMYSTLAGKIPAMKEDFGIELTMENTAQMEEFTRDIRPELSGWLKRELKNKALQIFAVVHELPGQRPVFTTEDKYKSLVNKNPLVDKLRQQLNLEFE